MNGQFAQLIALVSYGNVYLNGGKINLSNNSTLQYVSSTKFFYHSNKNDKKGSCIAKSVDDWFAFLRNSNVTRLWNIVFVRRNEKRPEFMSAGASNGTPIGIQVNLKNGFQYWVPTWRTGGTKKKPWLIDYHGFPLQKSFNLPSQNIQMVKEQLSQAVSKARTFALRSDVDLNSWVVWFEKSLILLKSSDPIPPYHTDILPSTNFSLEAHQLMAAAIQSYVFGGMGSWNDTLYQDEALESEYEKISSELYAAVKLAAITASNAFE